MEKTIIVLPDGRQISSGVPGQMAVQSCTVTQCVNAGTELTLGSVCAAMAEIRLILPAGGLPIAAGDELTVYKGSRKIGIFIAEKPKKTGSYTASVTAYDRVTRLDKDLTAWLDSLSAWPYTLLELAANVCQVCGLQLENMEIPNGSFPVEKFSVQGVTGRKLLQWIAESSGCFCRATAEGALEFAWYTPAGSLGGSGDYRFADGVLTVQDTAVAVTETEEGLIVTAPHWQVAADALQLAAAQYCFGGSLTYEDYAVAPIEKVQIRQSGEDVGVIYPNDPNAGNTYQITGNPLLAAAHKEQLENLAQRLYERLQAVTYTPCRVSVPLDADISAGQILSVTDKTGKRFSMYVMTKKQTGQKVTLECTGSHRRDSVSAVNEQSYAALSGKVLNLRTDIDGIRAENKAADGRMAALELSVEGFSAQVEQQTADADTLRGSLSQVQQTANALQITVQTMQEQGVSRVQTQMGYTFDDMGLHIARQGQQMENLLDNTGMYVTRGGQAILQANSDGVSAADVTVRNYLLVGNCRLESYENNRTACFFVGTEG